jgi:hypothetical protein
MFRMAVGLTQSHIVFDECQREAVMCDWTLISIECEVEWFEEYQPNQCVTVKGHWKIANKINVNSLKGYWIISKE